ncbi:MAG: carbon-nitrogen hydrolase family protein [Myxococcales bacterium]|nr:carbon-nitrogen hydrolase family protein [Myxococcales bacterium]USN50787.1 MAG: carbon-nitrogen hydrolase family protein [Myxococcales bacterium]
MAVIVAVGQMTSGSDKEVNLSKIEKIVAKARARQAKFLSLPENCVYFGNNHDAFRMAEPLNGESIKFISDLAQKNKMWISVGGFQEQIAGEKKFYNSHVLIDDKGIIVEVYRKIHLFSVSLPDGSTYREDSSVRPGKAIVCHQTPFFKVALSICYDIRFSYLYWALRNMGAQVILVPAAFTDTTGKAHWEILCRARAIETQSYVLAAAQSGYHENNRVTYGHAVIVDPWGTLIAQCGNNNDIACAEIDLEYLKNIRTQVPIEHQQRSLDNGQQKI